jgi:hypothetical protein
MEEVNFKKYHGASSKGPVTLFLFSLLGNFEIPSAARVSIKDIFEWGGK